VKSARIQADLEALAEFRDPDQPGWTRRVFSEPYIRSREWIASRMRDAGLRVERDAAGNLIGTLAGTDRGPALTAGSHTDTVAGGGRFDGPVGVLGAIEVARCIGEMDRRLKHDLRVIDFLGEEPNDFGISCVGSRAIAGGLTAEHLALREPSGGRSLAQAIAACGGVPSRITDAAWPEGVVKAFVELHIEQGPVLEHAGIPIGVVSGIAGIERLQVTFTGQADHAGTTPMGSRHDALCAAADAILAVERLGSEGGGVGTTGRIESLPGALNVVPGHVDLWVEFRHTSAKWLETTRRIFDEAASAAGACRGVEVAVKTLTRTEPVVASEEVRAAMAVALSQLELESLSVPSGAGHDAVQMARLGPVGMLFVPSAGGRSHCPEEWTSPEQLESGVNALLATILVLDSR
jgi:N-carbamoyl-L-amino-acid hydrolase